MTQLVVVLSALLGLAVGSFLNVVIWRVPRGESIVSPRSRCPGCGHEVRSRDNVPLVSWLLLAGRCRDCGAGISARYPLVELLTAAAFASLAAVLGASWQLPAFLYLASIGLALAFIDIDVRRLPNVIVLPSYVVAGALLLVAAVAEGRWSDLGRALLGMAALYALYLLLVVIHPRGMGFGDVKLAGILGLCLGWLGWTELAVGAFAGFLLGGVLGGALMATGRATRKSAIPFGPFMLAGAFIGITLGQELGGLYVHGLGY